MHDYERLEVTQRARRLIPRVYGLTVAFPPHELYVLTKQMRSAAHSIGANIAEGAGRITKGEFRQFVSQATGSAFELEWHTRSAFDLGYLPEALRDELIAEIVIIKKLLYRLAQTLR